MDIDFDAHLRALRRSVTNLERDGKPARGVTLEREYDTTVDDLWDAVTNPERLPRWFLPISGDLEPGGRYQLEGNAAGTITECEPPHAFSATWEFGGETSWVEVRIAPKGDSLSSLTLCHICPVDDDFWPKYGPGAAGMGWDLGLIGLEFHVSDAPIEFDAETLATSDEGRDFIARASDAWARAAVEAGEDPAWADAAARRTTAFYVGEEAQEG
ncbi:MAG: SRPBCC family protein [Gemmatimonadota bacterium]